MRTVVDLSPEELADVKAFTQIEDVAAAIRQALSEYVRYCRRMNLKSLSGRVEMLGKSSELETHEST